MSNKTNSNHIVSDSERRGLIGALPKQVRPYASLMRIDRPIGAWLLFWPCAWGVALAGLGRGGVYLIALLAFGAFVMRSAGCVYNDIIDRNLDAKVERTRLRPLASGRASLTGAWVLLVALSLLGLVVLLQLNRTAQVIGLASLALVAAYPFMKRITWWPQAWLGLVFSWGALVGGAAVTGKLTPTTILLYIGSIFWVVGYDTIYALQDREDDALVGVKSSARALGKQARLGVALFYITAIGFWMIAIWTVRSDGLAQLALLPVAGHLIWQVITLKQDDPENALDIFRTNRFAGLLMFLACLVVGTS